MKPIHVHIALTALLLAAIFLARSTPAEQPSAARAEYVTIRWAGKENTHIIRAGGEVEFIGSELRKLTRPDRCDERSFYMNAAVNGLAKEGYEFAGMTPDEIVMKRGRPQPLRGKCCHVADPT